MIAGDQSVLQAIKYVITLDTDTQLPREAAWKIIATLDHPQNHPYYDPKKTGSRKVMEYFNQGLPPAYLIQDLPGLRESMAMKKALIRILG